MPTMKKDNTEVRAVGRRKTAAARVRISLGAEGITVNGKNFTEYFTLPLWQEKVVAPLKLVGKEKDFTVSVKVQGGGISSQAEAVRHGITRALVAWNEDFKPILKAEGYTSRDPRAKERKKPGLHKARRAHQWRKR